MAEKEKYCVFCMESMNETDSVCSFCKKNQDEYTGLPHQLKPGTVLNGKYAIGGVIGEGGFGITYMGRDLTLDMPVAVKEYYPAGNVNRNTGSSNEILLTYSKTQTEFNEGKHKFLAEARILARLTDAPGIVNVRDFFNENNTAYIVMEYLKGITLEKYLQSVGKIPVEKILTLMYPVMDALEQVHQKGLIHRDISPSNIILTGKWDIKLLDFGAAREVSPGGDKSLSVLLKHGYAPEEQYRGRGVQGAWTDVYALSATIYKCITGVVPEDSLQRMYFDDTKRPSELGVDISPEMEEVLIRGMSVQQQDRYQSMKELKEAFQNASKSAPVYENKTAQTDVSGGRPGNIGAVNDNEMTRNLSFTAQKVVLDKPRYPGKPPAESREAAAPAERPPIKEKPQKPSVKDGRKKKGRPEGKPKKGRLKKVLAYIVAAIVLIAIVVTIYNLAFFTTIGNERFSKNATSISVSLTKIPRAHLEKLSSFSHLSSLSLTGCMLTDEDVDVIVQEAQNMRELTSLSLSDNQEITSLGALTELTGLTSLNISRTSISDLSAITSFENLQYLYAADNEIEDISALSGLKELWVLHLENNAISDISVLGELEGLNILDMSNNSISDISALADCPELYDVTLAYNDISDLSAFSNSTELTYVDLSHNSIVDISPIAGNYGMFDLDLSHNQIEDISALYNMREIVILDLSSNNISDASVLSRLPEVGSLSIAKNQITDIGGVTVMSRLYSLDISNNRISDISPLQGMQQMYVTLYGNEITDISPMVGVLKSLVIDIHNNNISDVSALAQCQDLISVILFGNPITDMEQLTHIDTDKIILEYSEDADYSALSGSEIDFYIYNVPQEDIYDLRSALDDNVTLISDVWTSPEEEEDETEQTDG